MSRPLGPLFPAPLSTERVSAGFRVLSHLHSRVSLQGEPASGWTKREQNVEKEKDVSSPVLFNSLRPLFLVRWPEYQGGLSGKFSLCAHHAVLPSGGHPQVEVKGLKHSRACRRATFSDVYFPPLLPAVVYSLVLGLLLFLFSLEILAVVNERIRRQQMFIK